MTRPGKNFKAILLDMNGTFIFGQDRFGPTEDFFATYQCVRADRLTSQELEAAVRSAHLVMGENYSNPEQVDDFPSLAEALHRVGVPGNEVSAMEHVFAAHKIGQIPADHLQLLQDLGAWYDLGIVSNIWAPKGLWLNYFEQLRIENGLAHNALATQCFFGRNSSGSGSAA